MLDHVIRARAGCVKNLAVAGIAPRMTESISAALPPGCAPMRRSNVVASDVTGRTWAS